MLVFMLLYIFSYTIYEVVKKDFTYYGIKDYITLVSVFL